MVVWFERSGPPPARVPLSETTFFLGASPACAIATAGRGVATQHARVSLAHGEFVLAPMGEAAAWVNDERVPLMALRDGDRVRLVAPAEPGETFVFRNLLEGAFLPPGTPHRDAWRSLPPAARASHGPDRFAPVRVPGATPRASAVAAPWGGRLALKRLPPERGEAPDHWLRVLTALAGASHAALAPCVDGGYEDGGHGDGGHGDGGADEPGRWIATLWVEGRPLSDALGDVALPDALDLVAGLADGLAHLHARGVVHRDLDPANAVRIAPGRAAWIDFGHARMWRETPPETLGVVGTPGFVAPEEVMGTERRGRPPADVYGLAATAYALLTGTAPAGGAGVLESLAGSLSPPPSPRALGVAVPEAFDRLVVAGLAAEPARRPTAHAFARTAADARRLVAGGA
jgi:hypothetical protein